MSLITIYKIRMKGTKQYSRGRVEQRGRFGGKPAYNVLWKANGKEWTSEKLVKAHLLKCIEHDIDISGWEVMEFTQQPAKSLNEWCDAKMTFAMLNRK